MYKSCVYTKYTMINRHGCTLAKSELGVFFDLARTTSREHSTAETTDKLDRAYAKDGTYFVVHTTGLGVVVVVVQCYAAANTAAKAGAEEYLVVRRLLALARGELPLRPPHPV